MDKFGRNAGRSNDDASRSLKDQNLNYLLGESIDRSSSESAEQSIGPLSDIEDLPVIGKMKDTKAALRSAIKRIEEAITSEPSPILNALGLDKSQRKLVDAITAAEVLKFTMLNAMDAVRLLVINDFKKEMQFFTDEAIVFDLIKLRGSGAKLRPPRRVPFSEIASLGDFDRYHRGRRFMVIGKASRDEGHDVVLSDPKVLASLPLENVAADKVYIVGRGSDDEPIPVQGPVKEIFLGVNSPVRANTNIDKKLKDITPQLSDLTAVVTRNFKISAPAEGFITSVYRKIRGNPAIKPTTLTAANFAKELEDITLEEFKKLFEVMVQKTTGTKTDLVTFDPAEALVFGGLASIGSALGLSRPAAPTTPPGTAAAGAAGAAGAPSAPGTPAGAGSGGGGGGAGTATTRRHSLSNILNRPSVVTGATEAERKSNLKAIDQDTLRRELNSLVGGSVIFTESAVDRWCDLAGIKESR
jgi:hypothetical protein